MKHSKEANLGHGWMAKLHSADGVEALCLRNTETGGLINLPDESVKRLRAIFDAVDGKVAA